MKVTCPTCSSVLNIDDKKIPAGGARIKCPSCQAVFPVKPGSSPSGVMSSPSGFSSSPSGAVPLPGISAPTPQRQSWEEESTRVATVPLPPAAIPGATTVSAPPTNVKVPGVSSRASGVVPLPGISAPTPQRQEWEEESTRVASVPLPGSNAIDFSHEVPLPGPTAVAPAHNPFTAQTAVAPAYNPGASIPLPGATAAMPAYDSGAQPWDTGSVPLPGHAQATAIAPAYEAPDTSIPLPGGDQPWDMPVDDGSVPLPGTDAGSIPLPGSSPSGIPLPGAPAHGSSIPLPGSSPSGIPLPGSAQRTAAMPAHGSSIPLPGASPSGIPLPGSAQRTAAMPAHGGSIPLPGASPSGIPLPGSAHTAAMPAYGDEVPLPGADEVPLDDGFDTGAVPLPSADQTSIGEVPLPGGDDGGGNFDFSEAPPPAPGGFDFDAAPPPPAPVSGGFDFDAAPPPPAAGGFDFSEVPPPPPGGFDFSEAPPPPAPPPLSGGFDFSDAPPPPPAPTSGGFDFSDSPMPPAPPPRAATPAPAAPMSFGEVDFGGGGGDLEFDPTAGQKPAADDLEADLSAPIPSSPSVPAGPADGMEMLNFIDRTAKDAGAQSESAGPVRRFHVKRRSGKVFGPFEEAVIVKMLEDGQLLGNEEVSPDADSWHAIGSEPAFQAVISRLMESPSSGSTQVAQAPDNRAPSMERLKQLYDGRMAAVAVVQSKEPMPLKKKIPLIGAGVLVAGVLALGIFSGLATPYGFFALKLIFPAQVKPDTREFGYLQVARKGFLQDTWKSYRQAKDSANQALQIKEYPEARAVWSQSVFYLQRKFNKADPAELQQARDELVNIRLLGETHIEVLKTEAAAFLTDGDADSALNTINNAIAHNGDDLEAYFLRAEAYLLKKQPAQAKAEYEAILKKDAKSAKALHGLGLIAKAQNEFAEAAGRFAEALEADPQHLSSSVELAEISIVRKKELARGNELLDAALTEDGRALLAPAVLGKALALKAESQVVSNKVNEAVPLFEEALKADAKNPFTNGHLARAYMLLHQPEKAAPLFSVAVTAQPEDLENTEGYLNALIQLGKMDEATRVMAQANTRFPGNAKLSYLSARVADYLDNIKEAEESYKKAIAADAKMTDAYLYLSRLYIRSRRFNEAAPILTEGLNQDPENASMRVGQGELALHERDFDKAEREFNKAIELNPLDADAYLGASRVSQHREKFELSAQQVEKALELNPRIPGGRMNRGTALWKLGRLDEAITELDAAREADPKNVKIVVTRGAVKFDKGDLNGAVADLNSALVAEPGNAEANFYLARVKNAKSEHTQAIEAMKRALDYDSKNPQYLYWYGRILADARKSEDALAELQKALEIDPKYADALEAIGRISYDRNDFKKAVEFYEKTLEVDPRRNAVRALIGDAQIKMEDWGAAIGSYQKALTADPSLTVAYGKLGLAFQEKGDNTKAGEWYRKAVKVNPDDGDAWLQLGFLLKDQKKKKDAVTAFKKYLELRPDAENVKEVRDQIHYMTNEE